MAPISHETMTVTQAPLLAQIDRSEVIDLLYEMQNGELTAKEAHIDCASWDADALRELQERYIATLAAGGFATGAFSNGVLVGFGVLGHAWIGENGNQLAVELLYVSRDFRRRGIGTQILDRLAGEARKRGAVYLYVSSTETRSAVSFYRHNGSALAATPDEALFSREPKDIHMIIRL
ncbi:GNAT family N-acetyltransferase [Chitinophaga rhizosphaerae]|uniref:GNAT family N-acetyltransferase n=1 Tax=Chitinophaga rhizosphaerae TaxID=1864947 RepID=UPI000F80EE60|nr:GNAT family N-acetyltransferase [Chitinophaga rhizosphaerae]